MGSTWGLVAAQERAGDTPNDATMATLIANKETFQHMIRVANTNIDGKQKAGFALTSIKGIGRRFCNIALKKAEIDPTKRAGELTQEEIDQFMVVVSNPRTFKIPDYILNRRKDFKDGRYGQIISSTLDNKLRGDSRSGASTPRPLGGGEGDKWFRVKGGREVRAS